MQSALQKKVEVPTDLVELGRVSAPYGVRGWFKVAPHASAEALLAATDWWLKFPPDQSTESCSSFFMLITLLMRKRHSSWVIAHAQQIPDRDASERLKGCTVWVSRSAFPAIAEDEYYWVDLLGLTAFNVQNQYLGKVVGLLDNGVHPILRLAYSELNSDGVEVNKERLVPFVKAYLCEVNWSSRRILIDWQLDY